MQTFKQTVFIHLDLMGSRYADEPVFTLSKYDYSQDKNYRLLCQQEIEFSLQDDFNKDDAILASLESQKEAIQREANKRIGIVQEQIEKHQSAISTKGD